MRSYRDVGDVRSSRRPENRVPRLKDVNGESWKSNEGRDRIADAGPVLYAITQCALKTQAERERGGVEAANAVPVEGDTRTRAGDG